MCGIAGFIVPKPTARAAYALRGLLIANQSRGSHATGVYMGVDGSIQKKAVKAEDFIHELNLKKIGASRVAFGHTRYATVGAKEKDENAHPFQKGKIVGVHNGMVSNYRSVYKDAQVDSEAIFHALSEKPSPQEAFESLQGSMAVAYTQEKTDELRLFKHTNPLYLARTREGIYFSSEEGHLRIVMSTVYGSTFEIESVKEGHHLVITPDLKAVETEIQAGKAVAAYLPPAPTGSYSGKSYNAQDWLAKRHKLETNIHPTFHTNLYTGQRVDSDKDYEIVDNVDVAASLAEAYAYYGPTVLSDRQLYIVFRALFGCHSCKKGFTGNQSFKDSYARADGAIHRLKEQVYCSDCFEELSTKKRKNFHFISFEMLHKPMVGFRQAQYRFNSAMKTDALEAYEEALELWEKTGENQEIVVIH
jgi:hypothetical protein